jgi:hypothetical protein
LRYPPVKVHRRLRVQRLDDRQTGRATYRYTSQAMSSPLPAVLYKYLPLEYATDMRDRGDLMFSTLTWFQNVEDQERGDEYEGTRKYFPVGGLHGTRLQSDVDHRAPVPFVLPNHSLHSLARGGDRIFMYSLSRKPDLTQFELTGGHHACVEIHSPATFLAQLRSVLRRIPVAKVATLIHDEVRYYSFDDPPENVHALPDRLTMHKSLAFKDQHEYRIAFGTRRDVFDFENVDYLIVREDERRRRRVLKEPEHRWKLTVGSLAQCCRLL